MGKEREAAQKKPPAGGKSKYALKLLAEERRTSSPKSPPAIAVVKAPPDLPTPPILSPIDECRRVTATLKIILFRKGCLFLTTTDGQEVYCGLNNLKRDHGSKHVKEGDVFDCDIEPHPKGLRVKKIYSVTPAT